MDKKQIKHYLKKIWWFIWESDSIWSWIVNIILAFVIIKFLVYPGLGLIFQTTHPIVAVVSSSMEHDGNFDTWWDSQAVCSIDGCTQSAWYNELNITEEQFKIFPFKNGFNKGDIMILKGTPAEKLKVGDILVFQSTKPDPIIHRIVEIKSEDNIYYFQTKGDHNIDSININSMNEENTSQQETIGYQKYEKSSKAILRIPLLGYVKIAFVELLKLFRII